MLEGKAGDLGSRLSSSTYLKAVQPQASSITTLSLNIHMQKVETRRQSLWGQHEMRKRKPSVQYGAQCSAHILQGLVPPVYSLVCKVLSWKSGDLSSILGFAISCVNLKKSLVHSHVLRRACVFLSFSFLIWWNTLIYFPKVEPALHSWDKSHLRSWCLILLYIAAFSLLVLYWEILHLCSWRILVNFPLSEPVSPARKCPKSLSVFHIL